MKGVQAMLIACVTALCACASTSNVRSMSETQHTAYVPSEEEQWAIEQADKFHAELAEQGLLYRDGQVTSCLARIEGNLLSNSEQLQDTISLFILKSPTPNALALPNGRIYLNAGLFTPLESENQLAAIAAHEIAHVIQRHSTQAIISQKNKLIGSHILDFATGGFGLVYLGTYASIMSFSREQEQEADEEALILLEKSGYPKTALLQAFQALNRYSEFRHNKQSLYSSHPSFVSRMKRLEKIAGTANATTLEVTTREDEFNYIKAKMMESSLRMRLRNKEFNQALTIVEEADNHFPDSAKKDFFRGEVYYGFYKHPKISAKEYYWIQTGKYKADEETEEKFFSEMENNLSAAIKSYKLSIQADQPYAKALRRLGEIAEIQGQDQQALYYFNTYLKQLPDARDVLYVKRALNRLGQQSGDSQ